MCMHVSEVAQRPPISHHPALTKPTAISLAMLQTAMKATPNLRLFQRYPAVFLIVKGCSYAEVGTIIPRSITTVYNDVQALREGGLPALNLHHSPGRPHYLTPDQEQQVAEVVIHKTPQDVGFPAEMNWTAPLVARYIAETFSIEFSEQEVRSVLYRMGFTCTRPTYTLAKADPAKQDAFKEAFKVQKQRLEAGEIDRSLFADARMIRDYQAIGRTGFLKGQQKQIPTFGKHWGAKLLATWDDASGDILCHQDDHYDATVFLSFLQTVQERYNGDHIVRILDNARIHHAKLIHPFLDEHQDTLTLMFLPPSSPQLNGI